MTPTEVELILKKLDHIFETDAWKDMKAKVDKLDECIRGNGKIGLSSRMTLIENWKDGQIWFQRVIAVALVGELLGMIGLLIKELVTK